MAAERIGDKWEYWTGFMFANLAHALLYDVKWEGAKQQLNALEQTGRDEQTLDFVPEALMPVLNERGADGWELVALQPVTIDPGHGPARTWFGSAPEGAKWWSHAYLCVMKRRLLP